MGDGLVCDGEKPAYEFDPLSKAVIGAAIAVHTTLGPGFREDIYERALRIELQKRGVRFRYQVPIPIFYDGQQIGLHRLDLIVDEALVIELKSASTTIEVHQAQLLGYLRAANLRVGLLLNFAECPLGIRRVVNHFYA